MDDSQHAAYLSQFDVGLAFYKKERDSSNRQGLLYSSGKIASYLWAGLAVLTNICHPITKNPPFLYADFADADALPQAIARYRTEPDSYREAAIETARKYYNMNVYMDKIMPKLNQLLHG